MKKIIVLIIYIFTVIPLFSQYKGGNNDGYDKLQKGLSSVLADSVQQTYLKSGGNYDGYIKIIWGRSAVLPDSIQQTYLKSGGNFDGYSKTIWGRSAVVPDSIQQYFIISGGTYDGYSKIFWGRSPVLPDSLQLIYIKTGGNFDGVNLLKIGRNALIPDSVQLVAKKTGGTFDGYNSLKAAYSFNQPKLKFPEQNSKNNDTVLTLLWTITSSFDEFQLQVSKTIDFVNLEIDEKNLISLNYNANLNSNTIYYWKVRSIKDNDTSLWSDIWNFKTESGPYLIAPTLKYPLNNASFIETNSSFGWNTLNDADYYEIQFCKKSDFFNLVKDIKVNDSSLVVFDLAKETKYNWRVRAINRLYISPWSDSWSFTTTLGGINGIVQLISPSNNVVNQDSSLLFKWSALTNCTKYNFTIFLSDSVTVFKNIEVADTLATISGLKYNTKFTWGVKGLNNADTSDISDIWTFSTRTYPIPDSWAHNTNSENTSIVKIPDNVYCKVGNRNMMTGDAVGVFYKRNDSLICSGYGIWNDANLDITVYSDDISTLIKDGFDNNEIYNYNYWDGQLGKEYKANAVYHTGSDDFFSAGSVSEIDTLKVITSIRLKIMLNAGWNMISSNIIPSENDSIQVVCESILDNLVIAKNNNGEVYIPQYDINNIGQWDITQGYQVYMLQSDSLEINGLEVNPSEIPVILIQGWNMIAYLRNSELDCETAFAGLTDKNILVIVKDNDGNVYIPEYGINTIGNLVPGQGYQVYVLNADVLVYPGN